MDHGQSSDRARSSAVAADLDADGDLDVLSSSRGDSKIAWYENTDGAGAFGSQQIISSLFSNAEEAIVADIDGDGDLDAVAATFHNGLNWFDNTDGLGGFSSEQSIATQLQITGTFAADLDGDGDLDVLSASWSDDRVAWYENTDGQRNLRLPADHLRVS